MRLPCSQCNRIHFLGNFYAVQYYDNGFDFLCSIECKEKWFYPNTQQKPKGAL